MKPWISQIITRITPDCRQIARLCSQQRDRKLSLRERLCVRLHCKICSWCVDYSSQIHQLCQLLQGQEESLADLSPDTSLSHDSRQRLRDRLTREQDPSAS